MYTKYKIIVYYDWIKFSGKFSWHGLTFKNWAKATCVLQASFTVSMAFMKLFTYPLYASRTIDLQNCSKMKYKTAIRGGSMVWLLRFQIYKQLLQVHIWLNYHWLDLFLAVLNTTGTGFINSKLLYFFFSHNNWLISIINATNRNIKLQIIHVDGTDSDMTLARH